MFTVQNFVVDGAVHEHDCSQRTARCTLLVPPPVIQSVNMFQCLTPYKAYLSLRIVTRHVRYHASDYTKSQNCLAESLRPAPRRPWRAEIQPDQQTLIGSGSSGLEDRRLPSYYDAATSCVDQGSRSPIYAALLAVSETPSCVLSLRSVMQHWPGEIEHT